MKTGYFVPIAEHSSGGRYRADPATGGPWDPGLQHGGPPTALLVHTAERLAEAGVGAVGDLIAMRLAAEFIGPVPVAEVAVEAEIVRSARTAVLVAVRLTAQERPCLQGRVWLVRHRDTSAVAALPAEPQPEPRGLPGLAASFPYGDSIEWQTVSGSIDTPGPGVVWARPRRSVVAGRALSGLQRVCLIGDSASGISAELSWAQWSFLNIDLDVHLSRPVLGDWIKLDARTTLGPAGAALGRSTVSDLHGEVGATTQTLVVVPR